MYFVANDFIILISDLQSQKDVSFVLDSEKKFASIICTQVKVKIVL